ncbi:hypothetical protein [Bifidobacterium castoris]|uniref:Uncharacterized protein n=1 Tax=Bifidobacterium castoris TaxID=2306972 RepID=A0A430F4Z2_9BIFI|nr:hypothetical protein [Bifidobacterium castoris]RSX44686.1 hypothetical protein D2E22_1972 [Bifidobacterium castoris]
MRVTETISERPTNTARMRYMGLARAVCLALCSWAAAAVAVWFALVPLADDSDNGAAILAAIAIAAAGTWPLAHNIRVRIHWALWLKYNRR